MYFCKQARRVPKALYPYGMGRSKNIEKKATSGRTARMLISQDAWVEDWNYETGRGDTAVLRAGIQLLKDLSHGLGKNDKLKLINWLEKGKSGEAPDVAKRLFLSPENCHGLDHTEATIRILEWFRARSEEAQQYLLGQLATEDAMEALQSLLAELSSAVNEESASPVLDEL